MDHPIEDSEFEQKHLQEINRTRRATVPALEESLFMPHKVLDHGFVRVIDYMGDDAAIVQAARVSYGKGTKRTNQDRGLIRYLLRKRHTSPFEMCEIKLHVKLPIFIARQWIRHRTANVNEYSARYSILDKEFYIPDSQHLNLLYEEANRKRHQSSGQDDLFDGSTDTANVSVVGSQSMSNKQGRGETVAEDEASWAIRTIRDLNGRAYSAYQKLLNEDESGEKIDSDRAGLARELARAVLPVNIYTQWYWKVDLHNLLHFLSLRADAHAQFEIRAYAEVIAEIVKVWCPITYEAFMDYRVGGTHLSAAGLGVVRRLLAGEDVDREKSGLSPREWRELMESLGRDA